MRSSSRPARARRSTLSGVVRAADRHLASRFDWLNVTSRPAQRAVATRRVVLIPGPDEGSKHDAPCSAQPSPRAPSQIAEQKRLARPLRYIRSPPQEKRTCGARSRPNAQLRDGEPGERRMPPPSFANPTSRRIRPDRTCEAEGVDREARTKPTEEGVVRGCGRRGPGRDSQG
jgi:hypothetical protein